MEPTSFYTAAGQKRWDKARLILSLCSRDMVEDIVSLINSRGSSVVTDIFDESPGTYDPPRVLGVLSRDYVADDDVPSVLLGLSTIMLSELRRPTWDNDRYQKLLEQAFDLDAELAEPIAKNIETIDSIPLYKTMPDGTRVFQWGAMGDRVMNGLRRALNWIPEILQLPWEIDQNQSYDSDFLYETSKLGEAVANLNRRARLMTGQAQISMNLGVYKIQDDDPESNAEEVAVGDIFSSFQRRRFPLGLMGNMRPLASMGSKRKAKKSEQLLSQAGYSVDKAGTLKSTGVVRNHKLKAAVDKVLAGRPSKAALLGALTGMGLVSTGLLAKLLKNRTKQGDPGTTDIYGEIHNEYGGSIADAWLAGDIDAVVKHSLNGSTEDYSTGDPEMDDALEQSVGEAISEDLGDMEPEVGGIFARMALNRAKKRAVRRQTSAQKRAGRVNTKMAQRAETGRLKAAGSAETKGRYIEYPEDGQDQGYDTEEFVEDEGGYVEDTGGSEDLNTFFPSGDEQQ